MKTLRLFPILLALLLLFTACDGEPVETVAVEKAEIANGEITVTYADGYVLNLGSFLDNACGISKAEDGTCFVYGTVYSKIDALKKLLGESNVKQSHITERGIAVYYIRQNKENYENPMSTVTRLYKTALTELAIPSTYEGNNVTRISPSAFTDFERLETLTLGENMTVISSSAFQNCVALKNVSLPSSLTLLEDYIFEGCHNLTNVTYAGTVSEWEAIEKQTSWNGDASFTVVCTDGTVEVS